MDKVIPSKGLEWTNLAIGLGLACAAVMFTKAPAAAWNAMMVGALIASCSAVALYRYQAWAEWSNVALGGWAILSPYLFDFGQAPSAASIHVIAGICVFAIAAIQLANSGSASAAAADRSPGR